jgi:hypothetical protein
VICARGVPITTSLLDPAGVVVEAYAGMLQIDDQDTYGPVDWSQVPNALRLRDGVVPPESFFTHGAPGRAGACNPYEISLAVIDFVWRARSASTSCELAAAFSDFARNARCSVAVALA